MVDYEFIPLAPLLATLGVMLTLSIMVERFLMIAAWLIDRLFLVRASTKWEIPGEMEQKLQLAVRAKREEDLLKATVSSANKSNDDFREIEPNPVHAQPESKFDIKPFVPGKLTSIFKEFWLQILGTFVAVAGCYYMKFSVWILVDWLKDWASGEQAVKEAPTILGMIFTGIIIGSGSKPVHFLMNFLLNRRIILAREQARQVPLAPLPVAKSAPAVQKPGESPAVPSAPASSPGIESIIGFKYDGGYLPERLETTHIRSKPIDLIVYHHTAMHSDSPFAEVIQEFERKGWLTGYHCVVLKDGTIRIFCRWDRIGNHARGHNDHSLGIALHGNFEPDPRIPSANINGQLGISFPTQEQLASAAKIVALWIQLYGIKLDFNDSILPHDKLANKACPGSNFPHNLFRQMVEEYANQWKDDQVFKAELEKFKAIPRVLA